MALSNLTVTWGLVFQPVAEVALLALLLPVVPARLIYLVSMARTPVWYSSLALAKRLRLWVTRTPFCIPTIRSKKVSRIPRNTPFSQLCSNRCCDSEADVMARKSPWILSLNSWPPHLIALWHLQAEGALSRFEMLRWIRLYPSLETLDGNHKGYPPWIVYFWKSAKWGIPFFRGIFARQISEAALSIFNSAKEGNPTKDPSPSKPSLLL